MKTKKFWPCILFLIIFSCSCDQADPDYLNPKPIAQFFDGEQFVGSATCKECHADIYAQHLKTAHFNTSAVANGANIKGSFRKGANRVAIGDLSYSMTVKGNEYYQVTTSNDLPGKNQVDKFDIVIGSGVKGQSYLTWQGDELYQLQVSYFPPSDTWINSPGFPLQELKRPIRDGCLKCHVTFATNQDFSGQGNRYHKEQIVFGVDCERCHRPSAKHVIYHRTHPEAISSQFMLKLDTLPRSKRMDLCAQCHSGPRDNIIQGNSFSYLAGETLDDYSRNFHVRQSNVRLDVHGNQYGLLIDSRCFKESANLDCMTCHDPHTNQRGLTELFIGKCLGCHQNPDACTVESQAMKLMKGNCISCHMPSTASQVMSVQLAKDSVKTPVFVRTHLIGIYPQDQWNE